MRTRKTFACRETFDVAASGETLYYGPRTAEVVSVISGIHADILEDSERAQAELGERIRQQRQRGLSRQDAVARIRATNPELWERAFPWQSLDRIGIETIHTAALADTQTIHEALYAGEPIPFVPCRTPLDAHRRYSQKSAA